MTSLILGSAAICLLATSLHLASVFVALVRCRIDRRLLQAGPDGPGISVLRPVCGIDNYAEETLRSTFELAYPRYEVIFCVELASDPVVPLLRHLMASYPHVQSKLLIGHDSTSPNPKLNNLIKGWPATGFDWVVIADSNVLMPVDYLQRLMATWQADTGLVCSPPVGCRPQGIWAELECAFLNTYQARWQYFADSIGLGFAQGKTMLWRRADLDRAGGIRALAAELAEDAASTKVVRAAGLRVRLVDGPFGQPLGWRSASEVWRRQIRWARLRRATFKWFFVPELLAGGVWALSAGAVVASTTGLPVAASVTTLGAVWYGAEVLLAYRAGWHLSRRAPLLWLLRDLVLPLLWVSAWLGNEFEWRGNRMRLVENGPPDSPTLVPAKLATAWRRMKIR